MSIGLGIFLGCVFLGTVLLYLKTANTWNWKKIVGRSVGGLVAFLLLVVLWVYGFDAYQKWKNRPDVVTSLFGISIGEKFSDVVFKHGEFKLSELSERAIKKNDASQRYYNADKRVAINVLAGTVTSIIYGCAESLEYSSLNGIACGDSGDRIFERFKGNVRVQCPTTPDKGSEYTRVYDVVQYGTRYYVILNKVQGLGVFEKQELESLVGLNWGACK